jgi:hypothetical protein
LWNFHLKRKIFSRDLKRKIFSRDFKKVYYGRLSSESIDTPTESGTKLTKEKAGIGESNLLQESCWVFTLLN